MSGTDPQTGLATAAGLALKDQAARPAPEPEQLDLLGLPPINNGQQIVAPRPGQRGRGRRTQEWIDHLLTSGKYPSPLETLLALGNISVIELAKSVQCSTHEAVLLKVKCLEVVLPFLHPRLSAVEIVPPGDPKSGIPSRLELAGEVIDVVGADEVEDEPEP
jgi:hypothetical protein